MIRSNGTLVRDYLYVRDAAEGVLRLADAVRERPAALRGEAFNFAAGVRLSVREIVEDIVRIMGTELRPIIEGRDLPEIPEQRVSAAKARRVLGWRPASSLDLALRESIDWYRERLAGAA